MDGPGEWLFWRQNREVGSAILRGEWLGNQKTLIPLHFSNPKLHNKLLARQHPSMG
jgi:hypothetical protein